jgi:hypothetical protein
MFSPETTKKFSKRFPLLSTFQRETRLENFTQELAEKSFAQRYEPLYFLGLTIALIAQLLSVWSSYAAVEKLVQIKVQHADALFALTLSLLLLIEIIKFYLVHLALRDVFALKPIYPYPLLIVALLWSLGSIYLSVSGSTTLAYDTKTEKVLTTEQAGKEKELKSEIAKIRDTDTYKSIIWDEAGKTSKVLTEAGKALVAKREAELDSLRKTYQAKTQQFASNQAQNIKHYNFFFALWEILFLACTWGIFYYKRMCAVEKCILPEVVFTVPTSENTPTSKHFQVLQSEIDLLKSQLEKALSDVPEALQSSLKHFEATEKNASNPILNLPTHEAEKPEKTADTSKHFEATESKKIGFEVPTSKSTTDTSEKVKRQFEALLARYHNGKAKYLQKYRQAVEHTLQLQNAAMPTVDICKEVSQKFDVSTSTFYNILRIINNTDK